jgi:hypothetical protein
MLLELIRICLHPAFRFEAIRIGEYRRVVVIDIVRERHPRLQPLSAFTQQEYGKPERVLPLEQWLLDIAPLLEQARYGAAEQTCPWRFEAILSPHRA